MGEMRLLCAPRWHREMVPTSVSLLKQEAEKVRQPVLFMWSVWSVWFVWSVLFIWLNQTNQTGQRNQMNQINHNSFSAACEL